MANEIDRLEIVIEAEASKANRSLGTMEKKLNRVADSLERTISLASGLSFDGGAIGKGFDTLSSNIDKTIGKMNSINKKSITPKIKDSELKKNEKSLDGIFKKYKDAGIDIDLSDKGFKELEMQSKLLTSSLDRLYERFDKKLSIEGTERLGKSWDSLIYDIQRVTNQLDLVKKKMSELKSATPLSDIKINRGDETPRVKSVSVSGGLPKTAKIEDPKAYTFDSGAMDFIENFNRSLDDSSINTFSAQIKRLKAELIDLGRKGYTEYDPEYDRVAEELARVTLAQKRYNKEKRESAKQEKDDIPQKITRLGKLASSLNSASVAAEKFSKSISSGMKRIPKVIGKASDTLGNFVSNAKKISTAFASPIKTLGRFSGVISGTRKEMGKGFSIPKMVGMSILFSTVFGIISGIKKAIAEGSNNLVQYSGEYNSSISSMVSSLMYLKNAWAAAFAPIINVVAPLLSSFIDMIARALNTVGTFMAALTGKGKVVHAKKVMTDYGASLVKTGKGAKDAGKAMKELENYMLGIDELNVLQPQQKSGGSGGGSGAGSGGGGISPKNMFETVEVKGPVSDFAKQLRQAFLKEDWEGLGKILAQKLNSGMQKLYNVLNWENVGPKITRFTNAFTRTLNSLVDNINWNLMGRTVGTGINTIVNTMYQLITGINWKNLGFKFADGFMGMFNEINWGKLGKTLGAKFMSVWYVFWGFVKKLDYAKIGSSIASGINGALQTLDLGTVFDALSTFAVGMLQAIGTAIAETDWSLVGQQIANAIKAIDWIGIAKQLAFIGKELIGGIFTAFGELPAPIQLATAALGGFFLAFKGIPIISGFISAIGSIISKIVASGGLIPALKLLVSALGGPFTLAIGAAITVGTLLIANWDKVKSAFQRFDNFLQNVFKIDWTRSFGTIGEVFNSFSRSVSKIWESTKRMFNGIITFITGFFSLNWKKAWKGIVDTFGGLFGSIAGLAKAPLNAVISLVNSAISALNKVSVSIPDWVPGLGGKKFGINIPKIPKLADGGMLNTGQMFIAREKGPELVGNYGNKTAVMNNNQIVQSVSAGVERAVARQNVETNILLEKIAQYQEMLLHKEVSVNIDGKKADKQISRARMNTGYAF